MESLHNQAFRSDQYFRNVVEGHLENVTFDVRLQRTNWKESGEGVFQPALCFIEMFLSTARQVRGSFVTAPTRKQPYLGNISFVPERAELYCSWTPGVQRSISCIFDIRALCARTALEWSWPEFDLEEALNIRNEYVSLGLRRIAEEVLSPGFASEQQIECNLMFVALELRRHFMPRRALTALSCRRLSPGQLAVLRGMMIDSAAPPNIGELAAECGMGGRQLARAYRSATGITLRSFMAAARLERAKMLLCNGNVLIKQIAYEAGFRSAAAFTAAFRRETGQTPGEFRAAKISPQVH